MPAAGGVITPFRLQANTLGAMDPQSDSGVDSEVSLEDVYFDIIKLREDITHMKTCLETCLNKMISDHIVVSGVESSQELQTITTKLLKAASAAQELLTPDGKGAEELQLQEETCQEDVSVSTPADEASNDDDDDEKLQWKESGQKDEAVSADLPASAAAELQEEAAVSDKMPPKTKKSLWRRFCQALGLREPTEGTKKMMETKSVQRGDGENTEWVSAPPAPVDEDEATEAQEEAAMSENVWPQTETLNLEIRPRKKWLHLLLGAVKKAPADEMSNDDDDDEKLRGEESSQKIIYVKLPPQLVAMDLQKYDSRQEEAVVFEMVL